MSARARWASTLIPLLLAAALVPVAFRPPRLTLLNAALRIDFAWVVAAAALGAAALLALASRFAPRRPARIALALMALLAAALGAARLRYRLEVQPDGLHARSLAGSTALAWPEVTHVDRGTDALVVWGRGDAQIRVEMSRFAGDQRAALERALARRIIESTDVAGR